jgi:uncharacterized protein HemX
MEADENRPKLNGEDQKPTQRPAASSEPAPIDASKKSSRAKKRALSLLLLVLICVLGGVAYWQYNEAQDSISETKAAQAQLSDKNTQYSSLQAKYSALKTTQGQDSASTAPVLTDDQNIKQVVTAKVQAVTADEDTTVTVETAKKTATFARATVASSDGGGYYCILKKVNTIWTVLLCGQDAPTQADMDKYSIPADIAKS